MTAILLDELVAEMNNMPTIHQCGKCLRTDGVTGRTLLDAERGIRSVLFCPCCSTDACPHDWPLHGEVQLR